MSRNVPRIHCQGLDFLSVAIEMSTYGFSSGSASFNLLFQRGIFINVSPHFTFLGTCSLLASQGEDKVWLRILFSFEHLHAKVVNSK